MQAHGGHWVEAEHLREPQGVSSSRPRIVTLASLLSTLLLPIGVGELLRPLLIGMGEPRGAGG